MAWLLLTNRILFKSIINAKKCLAIKVYRASAWIMEHIYSKIDYSFVMWFTTN